MNFNERANNDARIGMGAVTDASCRVIGGGSLVPIGAGGSSFAHSSGVMEGGHTTYGSNDPVRRVGATGA